MKSAVTISLVPEARGGPFIYWDHLRDACRKAADLGFDAVEIFPPSAEHLESLNFGSLLKDYGLQLAAVGTGAGWVKHKLSLSNRETSADAIAFAGKIIATAGRLNAPAIIGSMQGRWNAEHDWEHLRTALQSLSAIAKPFDVPLLYEPLNRYETNFCYTLDAGAKMIRSLDTDGVRLLADLFHMNIEEANLPDAIRRNGEDIGHVHLADSNRHPAGNGHTDFTAIASALRDAGYSRYISAEALPYPDSDAAAKATMDAFNTFFRS